MPTQEEQRAFFQRLLTEEPHLSPAARTHANCLMAELGIPKQDARPSPATKESQEHVEKAFLESPSKDLTREAVEKRVKELLNDVQYATEDNRDTSDLEGDLHLLAKDDPLSRTVLRTQNSGA